MGKTRFRIDEDLGVVVTASEGDLTSADVLEAVHVRCYHPCYRPELHVLWDMREVRFLIAANEVIQLNGTMSLLPARASAHKVALIVSSEIERAMAEPLVGVGPTHPVEYRSFFRRDEALAWLGLPEDLVLWPDGWDTDGS